jgi:hypothetical protein
MSQLQEGNVCEHEINTQIILSATLQLLKNIFGMTDEITVKSDQNILWIFCTFLSHKNDKKLTKCVKIFFRNFNVLFVCFSTQTAHL